MGSHKRQTNTETGQIVLYISYVAGYIGVKMIDLLNNIPYLKNF